MNLDIFKINDPSGKMYKESYVSKNFTEEYEFIIQKIDIDIPFKEKVYLVLNGIKKPICKNPNCKNTVKFKNSTIGYLDYCSNKCIGSDPNIIELKKQTLNLPRSQSLIPAVLLSQQRRIQLMPSMPRTHLRVMAPQR
jgi:hypothetical protein